ncbi:unnamed protein product [Rhizophagus irregularis]|nr:unnamed protein product [Rhizophagus irregularis]
MIIGHITSFGLGIIYNCAWMGNCWKPFGTSSDILNKVSTRTCQNKLSKVEYQGFPSGHSSTAFAGWVFLYYILMENQKPWTGGAHLWKILVLFITFIFCNMDIF